MPNSALISGYGGAPRLVMTTRDQAHGQQSARRRNLGWFPVSNALCSNFLRKRDAFSFVGMNLTRSRASWVKIFYGFLALRSHSLSRSHRFPADRRASPAGRYAGRYQGVCP
jgi:hypothetical protein